MLENDPYHVLGHVGLFSHSPIPTETGFPDSGYLKKRWTGPPFSNQLKIQRHFYRAYACVSKYFLMTEKLQQIRKVAYIPSLGPGGSCA